MSSRLASSVTARMTVAAICMPPAAMLPKACPNSWLLMQPVPALDCVGQEGLVGAVAIGADKFGCADAQAGAFAGFDMIRKQGPMAACDVPRLNTLANAMAAVVACRVERFMI